MDYANIVLIIGSFILGMTVMGVIWYYWWEWKKEEEMLKEE